MQWGVFFSYLMYVKTIVCPESISGIWFLCREYCPIWNVHEHNVISQKKKKMGVNEDPSWKWKAEG